METVRVINTGSSGRRTRKTGLRASKSGAGFQFDPSGIVTGSAENGGAVANSQAGSPAAGTNLYNWYTSPTVACEQVPWGRWTREELRSFCPTAFARTLVDSLDDIQHSTAWWTYLSRCYFSYPGIPNVQSLSFHAFSLFVWLKEWQIHFGRIDLVRANCFRANRPSGETTWYPREYESSPLFSLPVPEPVREPASMLLARFSRVSRYLITIRSSHVW